jgi:hypothetical protein
LSSLIWPARAQTRRKNDLIKTGRAKREFDVKKAEYDTDVNAARADADLAYDLQVNPPIKKQLAKVEIRRAKIIVLQPSTQA